MNTRNNTSNVNKKNNMKTKNNKGKNNVVEEESNDESFSASQENALLSTPPPLPNSPSLNNFFSSDIHLTILNLKEEIASLKDAFDQLRQQKDEEINDLKTRIQILENNNQDETPLSPDLSEIRNTVQLIEESQTQLQQENIKNICVITGSVPEYTPNENAKEAVTKLIEEKLKIKLKQNSISEVFRLGTKKTGNSARTKDTRPLRFKINEEGLKSKLISACIKEKPSIYVNEYLTAKNKALLKKALAIRKDHINLICSCYIKNGTLNVKRTPSGAATKIKNDSELDEYLINTNVLSSE